MRRMELRTVATGDLIRRLVGNIQLLAARQVRLVQAEARSDIAHTVGGGKLVIIGGLLLYAGAILLLVFLVFLFASLVPSWALALALSLLLVVAGGILALVGKQQIATQPLQKTRESLEEDLEWAKRQLTSKEK